MRAVDNTVKPSKQNPICPNMRIFSFFLLFLGTSLACDNSYIFKNVINGVQNTAPLVHCCVADSRGEIVGTPKH